MIAREELYRRRCVQEVVVVLEQLGLRAAARAPLALDEATIRWVALWTLLRWERNFLLLALEQRGTDVWALSCELDDMIKRRREADAAALGPAAAREGWSGVPWPWVDRLVLALVDQAAAESALLGHHFVGVEHLLLAIVGRSDEALGGLLARHGLTYEAVRELLVALVPPQAVPVEVVADRAPRLPAGPSGAAWDSEAVGVPRRFGMAVVMLIMTMYAVLFATMKLLNTHPAVFLVVAVLFTGTGLGQMLLFGGRFPRAASIWVGACLLPVEVIALVVYYGFESRNPRWGDIIFQAVCSLVLAAPAGAVAGYVAGVLTAGVFLLIEKFWKPKIL